MNIENIISNYIMEYYKNINNIGWNAILYLFDPACVTMLKDKKVGNAYDLLNKLATENIKKANYCNLNSKWALINNNNILVNTFGFISSSGRSLS